MCNVKLHDATFSVSFVWLGHQQATFIWKQGRGPASAVIATLHRIGWKATDYNAWVTDQGENLYLTEITPDVINTKVRQSVDRYLWHNCTLKNKYANWKLTKVTDHITGNLKMEYRDCTEVTNQDYPNWKLARRVVLGKDPLIGAMGRSVCINTQYPQSRISTTDDMWRACNVWTGNLRHPQFPDRRMCSESRKHVAKHLSLNKNPKAQHRLWRTVAQGPRAAHS